MTELKFATLLLMVTFSLGCNSGKMPRGRDIEKLMTSSVQLPPLPTSILKGNDTLMTVESKPSRMVILFDSTICGSCKISQIWQWSIIVNHAKRMGGLFEPMFIFAPTANKVDEVKLALRAHPFEWPVFIDSDQEFLKANPHIPKNKALHTFLLDKNNRVVLVGDPIGNDKLWGLYMKTIRQLIDNDGVLPEESSGKRSKK